MMKIIDLLNKIANGEKVPKKIKYDNTIYIYVRMWEQYVDEVSKKPLLKEISAYNYSGLNNEIEIIEDIPKEDKKIEKVNRGCIAGETLRNIDWHILDKLDEIIDKVNGE